jgi:hypothetical protein
MESIKGSIVKLMNKKSTTKGQNTFMEEFDAIYQVSGKKERKFLEDSINQIFRLYYYSMVAPETYISPANIFATFAKREAPGDNVFVPKVELIKSNGKLIRLKSTLSCVNTGTHYMVDDLEAVLAICKTGIIVDEFGIPADSERRRFKGRLFLQDRNYQNILVLVAINLGYLQIDSQIKKTIAITHQSSDGLFYMTVKTKTKLILEGIINNCVKFIEVNTPQFKGVFTKEKAWELLKNPLIFDDILDEVNERAGINNSFLGKKIKQNKEVSFEQIVDMFLNEPSSLLISLFFTQMDIYFFTPLSYYLQLIKPFFSGVYNIAIEAGNIYNVLDDDINIARNMLFSMPMEFDLTPLGEVFLSRGKKSTRNQEIFKAYNDERFLACFEIRDQYLEDEIDGLNDENDDDYENGEDGEELIDADKKVIDIFSYKTKKGKSR